MQKNSTSSTKKQERTVLLKDVLRDSKKLLEEKKHQEASELLTQVVRHFPDNFDAIQFLGLAKHLGGEHVEALQLLQKALSIKPRVASVHHNIAGIYRTIGEIEQAKLSYRKALDLKSDYGEAFQGLAELVRFQQGDPLIEPLEKQLRNKSNDAKVASYFNFAAGKVYDDCGEYAKAFRHYQEGNRLANRPWLGAENESYQKAICETFNAQYYSSRPERGLKQQGPIFIVGMPRSGSTLVEQILSSHSKVFGAGEVRDIQAISEGVNHFSQPGENYPECMNTIQNDACKGLGEAYIKRIRSLNHDSLITHYVDKSLYNFKHLGLIYDLLPNAKIIHICRHPLDSCLSSFFQNFSTGINWSFDLNTIIEFYRRYRKTMTHWQNELPMNIFHLKYEDLVSKPAIMSKRLIDFCGLPWEEACLQPHKSKRVVQTASVWQVRQPIYQGSKGRWVNYEQHINLLKEGLDDYINQYECELSTIN